MKQFLSKISEKIKKGFDLRAMHDLLAVCREVQKTDAHAAGVYLTWLSDECERRIADRGLSEDEVKAVFSLHREVCLAGARDVFHLFLLYMEWERDPDKKFYPPRKKGPPDGGGRPAGAGGRPA